MAEKNNKKMGTNFNVSLKTTFFLKPEFTRIIYYHKFSIRSPYFWLQGDVSYVSAAGSLGFLFSV